MFAFLTTCYTFATFFLHWLNTSFTSLKPCGSQPGRLTTHPKHALVGKVQKHRLYAGNRTFRVLGCLAFWCSFRDDGLGFISQGLQVLLRNKLPKKCASVGAMVCPYMWRSGLGKCSVVKRQCCSENVSMLTFFHFFHVSFQYTLFRDRGHFFWIKKNNLDPTKTILDQKIYV